MFTLLNATLVVMAQTTQPIPLFEERKIEVLLEKDQDHEIYLTDVALYSPTNLQVFWGSEIDDEAEFRAMGVEFTLFYHYREQRISNRTDTLTACMNESYQSAVAHFCKDCTEHKIFQAEFLDNWFMSKLMPSIDGKMFWCPVQVSFEAAKGRYRGVGTGNNKELLPVKVWQYVQKQQQKNKF